MLLLICAATIVYGSLWDWRFRVPPLAAWAAFWRMFYARNEVVLNIVLYLPLGYVGLAAFGRPVPAALFGLVLSACVETIQPFFGRMPQLLDILANGAGTLCGVVIADGERRLRGRVVLPPRPVAALAWWVLYQTHPFSRVGHAWSAPLLWRAPGSPGPLDLVGAVVDWTAFFALAAALLPRWPWLSVALAATAGPAKPFLSGRAMSTGEWVAWGVALTVAMLLARHIADHPAGVGMALAGWLLISELAPYRLSSSPAAFNWTPFRALLAMEWTAGTLLAARKAFEYGALVYLLGAPSRFGRATVAVCASLCALEWLQRWLPGRTPDITDPVIAAMLGAVIWLLPEPSRKPNTLR